MNDFWARQRAKAEAQQAPAQPVSAPDAPWWAQGTRLVPQQTVTPVIPNQDVEHPDGHDFSKAAHLKDERNCPECSSGNYMKPTAGSARRCFECGYVESRNIHDIGIMQSAVVEGPARQARQTASGGGVVNNYHGNIRTAGEAVGRLN